jgi:hypothetical protein
MSTKDAKRCRIALAHNLGFDDQRRLPCTRSELRRNMMLFRRLGHNQCVNCVAGREIKGPGVPPGPSCMKRADLNGASPGRVTGPVAVGSWHDLAHTLRGPLMPIPDPNGTRRLPTAPGADSGLRRDYFPM